LRKEIESAHLGAADKADANEVIDEIEGAFRSGNPKKSIVTALLKALPHVANVASIVSAIAGLVGAGA